MLAPCPPAAYNRAMPIFDVAILGAGASGLYCAIHAARRGLRIVVLDHAPKTARKVRVSGGGRCNFTNLATGPDNFLCANPHFVKSALARHTPWDVVSFFAEHGLSYEEKAAGQLFCTEGAGKIAGTLTDQAHKAGADIRLNTRITDLNPGEPFSVSGIRAHKVVMALGGPSWPAIGATRLALDLAKTLNLDVVTPRPALVPLLLSGTDASLCRSLAGTALPASVTCNGNTFTDDLLFTHKGISGPAVLQASSYWQPGQSVIVNLLPTQDMEAVLTEAHASKTLLRNFLATILPKRLAPALLPPDLADMPVNQLSAAHSKRIAALIHHWEFVPARTEGYARAEVTAGGINTDQFSSKTFECKSIPGLYAIGECLDVTGHLGGHNLQWAWSSAWACAQAL